MSKIFYDSRCRFCIMQIKILQTLDWFEVFQYIPSEESLKAVTVNHKNDWYQGLGAIRFIALRIPGFWWSLPLLYFPGATPLLGWLYEKFAEHRYVFGQCSDKCEKVVK